MSLVLVVVIIWLVVLGGGFGHASMCGERFPISEKL